MRNPYVNDLEFSWNGDLVLGQDGDLGDTSRGRALSFLQEAWTRVKSELGDWKIHPDLGSDLSKLIGEANTASLAESGKVRITTALTKDNFCDAKVLQVRYMPVGNDSILYNIVVNLPFLKEEDVLSFSLLFNVSETQLTLLE
jgi:hypothetical protein